jgi:ATP-dependent exoDNAse (exonuclease V) beta subunit
MSAAIPFTDEQRAAIEHRGGLLLTANAGSGKTSVMTERYVRAAREGEENGVGRILAITFTEKAATELRSRVRERFEQLGDDERARATESAWISTIHGFCARLLRTHALAAALDPRFSVLDERAADRLAGEAFDTALEDLVAAHGTAALELIATYRVVDLRDAIVGVHGELRSRGQESPTLPSARPAPLEPRRSTLALARAQAAVELEAASDGATVARARERLAACAALLERVGDVPPTPGEVIALTLPRNGNALAGDGCAAYRTALEAYADACADAHAGPVLGLLDALLRAFGERYAAAKRVASALDFEDLELRANRLLRDREPLRARYAERFLHVLVDELQDTNPLQLELLERIAGDRLVAVGDELQSIYGFRHADVRVFRARRATLAQRGATATLATNFRGHPAILRALNHAFAPRFGASFTPLVPGRGEPDAPDAAHPRVELLIADVAADWSTAGLVPVGTVAPAPLWRIAEARLLAARVRELLDGGRPAGEVVVLLRATGDLAVYERALADAGVPTYVIGGRGYWSQQQVRDLVAYLAVLANPRDGLALMTLLAAPLVGLSSDALVQLAAAARAADRDAWWTLIDDAALLGRLDDEDRDRVLTLRAWLPAERRAAPRHALGTLLDRVLARTGYDLVLLRMPGGSRRLANVRKLMRLAREHEAQHGRDLRGFVDLVGRLGDSGRADGRDDDRESEAPVEGETLDAVRLMTIHRAKGLEFPVVCVADLGRESPPAGCDLVRVGRDGRVGIRLRAPDGGRAWPALGYRAIGEERAREEADEEARLFYVAMTRAREQLVLSGAVACEPWPEGKPGAAPLQWIAAAFVPDVARLVASGAAPRGVAEHDGVAVRYTVGRPDTLAQLLGDTVAPAPPSAATPQAPHAPAPAPPPAAAPAPPVATLSYTSLQEHARCGYRFYLERVLRLPAVEGPHALAATRPGRPGLDAAQRGTVVHALLEQLDLARPQPPGPEAVRRAAARVGAQPTDAEVAELTALVAAFAGSALRARLAGAAPVRREQPFALPLRLADGSTIPLAGVFDAIAHEQTRALVVDYKSDRLDGADPREVAAGPYGLQRTAYALAALDAGAAEVEVVHCFLEAPELLASATFSSSDAPALAADLGARAVAVLAREFAVAPDPGPRLCDRCPGRGSLCSWPLERTRAPEGRLV